MRKKLAIFLIALLFPLVANAQRLPQTEANSTLTVLDDCVTIPIPTGVVSFSVDIAGTFSATYTHYVSNTGAIAGKKTIKLATSNGTIAAATTGTTTGLFLVGNNGYSHYQICATAYTSGTATITVTRGYSPPSSSSIDIASIAGATPVVAKCDDPSKVTTASFGSASGNVEIVALTTNQIIYVCGYDIIADGATDFQFIYGTGTACATGETDINGQVYPFDSTNGFGIVRANTGHIQFKTAVSNALCYESSNAVAIGGYVTYVKE